MEIHSKQTKTSISKQLPLLTEQQQQARLSPSIGTHGSSDGRLPVNKVFLSI
jgi:hypothetical protein